jgi:uncharacterized protein (TIGR02611 family)
MGHDAVSLAKSENVTNGWHRVHERLHRNPLTGALTKVAVTLVGLAVLLAGIVMMVAPGPGVVGILLGLAILATEYHWARRLLGWVRVRVASATQRARAMDPAVRRRRVALGLTGVVAVLGGVAAYVAVLGWPNWAVRAWNWVQGISSVLPELPGM